MLDRCYKCAFRLFLLSCLVYLRLDAGTRKAVLIGINKYNPSSLQRTEIEKSGPQHTFIRPKVPGGWSKTRFDNLSGAVNDVRLIEAILRSMDFTEFDELLDQQATADAILSTLYRDLVEQSRPGDMRFVYYSGHGSVANNRATGGQDETLVPADHWRDVPDVRDKELSRILYAAGKKGVVVTIVVDSCHSGSLSRGSRSAAGQIKTAAGAFVPIEVYDPPDLDSKTGKPIDPKDVGVLYFAATQRYEEAFEYLTDGGLHGAFTWALREALIQGPRQRAEVVFERTLAHLEAEGRLQHPVLDGAPSRKKGMLTGGPDDQLAGLIVTANSVRGGEFSFEQVPPWAFTKAVNLGASAQKGHLYELG